MAPEWDIAERDVAAVECLAQVTCGLPTLSSAVDLPREASAIEGGSFVARVHAVPDRGPGSQLRIYFEATAARHGHWSAWVRCDRPDRTDRTPERLAKRFRKSFKPAAVTAWEGSVSKAAPKFVRTAHWWVARDRQYQLEDITAQIWLFLLQTGMIGDEAQGRAIPWFWDYLERRFGFTDDESVRTFEMLQRQFWRAPSARAWSSYVGRCKYFSKIRVERWRSNGASRSAKSSDHFTVAEVSRAAKIPQSTLYDMIRRAEVAPTASAQGPNKRKPAILIPAEEVQRLQIQRRQKPKELIELRERITDSTYEAARKWVWRQMQLGRSVSEIEAACREERRR